MHQVSLPSERRHAVVYRPLGLVIAGGGVHPVQCSASIENRIIYHFAHTMTYDIGRLLDGQKHCDQLLAYLLTYM